ncbi:hypothetical protein [[Leptolyngbya] sp. PCC 7376]|uniref:hypothetical protein n=1 Tax=[Leptolyngbya] sp. PCC 7376 TaxID=111781 RepID=UPI0005A0F51F|nr:hypothetical protein [[Leptolyngbya] sp. PCC 7376]
MGDKSINIEIGIVCYETALLLIEKKLNPLIWARIKNNLGIALSYKTQGNYANNVEQAILSYKSALKIYSSEGEG